MLDHSIGWKTKSFSKIRQKFDGGIRNDFFTLQLKPSRCFADRHFMRKTLVAAMIALTTILGCESTPHYNRTKIVMVGTTFYKKSYGTVKLFQSKAEVTGTYDVIALMSVEGKAGDEAAFIKAFLYRAADVGADGLIFYRGNQAAGTTGGGWVLGERGGFGLPSSPQIEASYQGEAIHFK
jgi:hypothetical protein